MLIISARYGKISQHLCRKQVDVDMELIQVLLKPTILVLIIIGSICAGKLFLINLKYRKSQYGTVSGNNLFKTAFDTGIYGEFLTFVALEKLPGCNKILTNLYIPKDDGTTTEIDLLMLHQTGIYVFESKNYSGWIFGNEKSKTWTQTLGRGKKNKFFNPIWQNKGHIRALGKLLSDVDSTFYSYIVFSERCKLKKVSVASPNVSVIKRNRLLPVLMKDIDKRGTALTESQLLNLYEFLQKYTLVDDQIKLQHIHNIKGGVNT